MIEENKYDEELRLKKEFEKEIELTQKSFEAFLQHASKAVSLAWGGDHVNQKMYYAAAYEQLIDSYIKDMKDLMCSQVWAYIIEPDQISSPSEDSEKKDTVIEKERTNLKREDKKKHRFISFFKKLFKKS